MARLSDEQKMLRDAVNSFSLGFYVAAASAGDASHQIRNSFAHISAAGSNSAQQFQQVTAAAIQQFVRAQMNSTASPAATPIPTRVPPPSRNRTTANPWPAANPVVEANGTHIHLQNGRFQCAICRVQDMCVHMKKFFELGGERTYFPDFPQEEKIIYMPLAQGHAWIPVTIKCESGEIFGDVRSNNYLTAIVRERAIKGKRFEVSVTKEEGLTPVVRAIENYYGGSHCKSYEYIASRLSGQHLIPRGQRAILPCTGSTNHMGFKSEELFQRKFNGATVSHHDIIVAESASIEINGCCAECFIALELQGSADADW